jgi:hypothetical protein
MRDDGHMRTTLDIEDDVLLAVKQMSRQRHMTAGKLLSELARRAIAPAQRVTRKRNGAPLFPARPDAAVVTLELVNRLRDESP